MIWSQEQKRIIRAVQKFCLKSYDVNHPMAHCWVNHDEAEPRLNGALCATNGEAFVAWLEFMPTVGQYGRHIALSQRGEIINNEYKRPMNPCKLYEYAMQRVHDIKQGSAYPDFRKLNVAALETFRDERSQRDPQCYQLRANPRQSDVIEGRHWCMGNAIIQSRYLHSAAWLIQKSKYPYATPMMVNGYAEGSCVVLGYNSEPQEHEYPLGFIFAALQCELDNNDQSLPCFDC